jgi:hypothetical protein
VSQGKCLVYCKECLECKNVISLFRSYVQDTFIDLLLKNGIAFPGTRSIMTTHYVVMNLLSPNRSRK